MNVVRWESPPPPSNRGRWKGAREALEQHPGEWALVAENLTSSDAASARSYFFQNHYKVAQRKLDGAGYSIWAMYPLPVHNQPEG